jgi:hypothetical protein
VNIFSRCGMCNERLKAQSAQGILDAIRLHCREYHPDLGNQGKAFDTIDAKVVDFTDNYPA